MITYVTREVNHPVLYHFYIKKTPGEDGLILFGTFHISILERFASDKAIQELTDMQSGETMQYEFSFGVWYEHYDV